MKMEFWGGLVVGVIVCALVGLGIWLENDLKQQSDGYASTEPEAEIADTAPPERGIVSEIVDGITFKMDTGHVIRYLGVRVPGVGAPVQCFGKEVLAAQEAIIGKEVRLAVDPALERAADGAWVRYVYMVDDKKESEEPSAEEPDMPEPESPDLEEVTEPTPEVTPTPSLLPPQADNEILINERILEGGFGFPLVSEEVILAERMLSAARYASATGKGLWKQCEVTKDEAEMLVTNEVTECVIKGSVNVTGKKIYRDKECGLYGKTVVLPSQGGQWFCSEDEAKAAGYERAGDC